MKYFKLPDLGEGLPEAEIVEWMIKEGDSVTTDQILATVETAKAIIEIPSPQDGVIAHLFGQAGDTIHTGEPLLEFTGEDDDSGTVVGELKQASANPTADHFFIGAAPSTQAYSQKITPFVRSLAERLNVDTGNLLGNGQDGQLTADDIERLAKIDRTHRKAEPLRGVRKQMARNMALAHARVVPVTLCEDVDINAWAISEDITIRLIHAVAAGCHLEPALNVWFDDQQLARRMLNPINLGVAVDTDQGLFVPVLRDIGNRSLQDIRAGLNRLREDVIQRTIPPAELQGCSITLSNFGTIAGRYASPIVVPPTVAILGAGVIREQVVPIAGKVVIRRVMPLSLTFDHRVVTGGEAARFMRAAIDDLAKESIS